MSMGQKLGPLIPYPGIRIQVWPPDHPVNALLPGGLDTAVAAHLQTPPGALAFVQSLHAPKRMASPDEVAQSALHPMHKLYHGYSVAG